MSLRSTRKRLKEYIDLLRYQTSPKEEHDSFLSKFGVNPNSIIKNDKKENNDIGVKKKEDKKPSFTQNYIERKRIENAKKEAYSITIDPHEENIKKKIKFSKEKEDFNLQERLSAKKPKKNHKILILMAVVELFTLIAVFGIGMLFRFSNSTQQVPFDVEKVVNKEIDSKTLKKMQGYRTIAIFGLDSRTGSVSKGNNADVNIIANINYDNGEVKLVSVYRDLYLNVSDNNRYGKFNSAYFYGGPEGAVKALNKNLDLNITNYVSFNWKAVAEGIGMLGGIDLEIKKSEYNYMNSFIHETCIATGINGDNPAANYIKGPGMQHLNGVQAVAYARLRLMDSDFQRVERQKKVIALCLEKAKSLDFNSIMGIAINIIPTISYDFDWAELTSLVKSIDGIHIVESAGFPDNKHFTTMKMGANGDCVIPNPLNKAVIELHKLLYNDDEYTPSRSVNGYSGRIIELKEKFAEENRIEASRIAREKEEEERRKTMPKISTGSIAKKKKKATSSQTRKKANPFNEEDEDEIIVPEIGGEYEEYEEEPEDDVLTVPGAPTNNDKVVSPQSSTEKKDNNAPYNSGEKDNNAPYNTSKISGPPGSSNNDTVVAPIAVDEDLSSEDVVAVPPGVTKETTIVAPGPTSPNMSKNDNIVTPPVSGEPSEAINSGPPIG